jgi:hypothetical protein
MTEPKDRGARDRTGTSPKAVNFAPCPDAVTSHPLVGAGIHFKDDAGCVVNQMAIAAVIPSNNVAVGDLVLLQYFEWMMGDRTNQRLVPLTELASSDRWVIYKSVDEMNEHYDRVDHKRNEHIRSKAKGG